MIVRQGCFFFFLSSFSLCPSSPLLVPLSLSFLLLNAHDRPAVCLVCMYHSHHGPLDRLRHRGSSPQHHHHHVVGLNFANDARKKQRELAMPSSSSSGLSAFALERRSSVAGLVDELLGALHALPAEDDDAGRAARRRRAAVERTVALPQPLPTPPPTAPLTPRSARGCTDRSASRWGPRATRRTSS